MIYELTKHYDTLLARGADIPKFGWANEKITMGLFLRDDGSLSKRTVRDIKVKKVSVNKNGKEQENAFTRSMRVPYKIRQRTSTAIVPMFLHDDVEYMLGFHGAKERKADNSAKQFAAMRQHVNTVLEDTHTVAATAIKNFFNSWSCNEDDLDKESLEIIRNPSVGSGKMVVFLEIKGIDMYAFEEESIARAWDNYCDRFIHDKDFTIRESMKGDKEGKVRFGTCSITGEKNVLLESSHLGIKNIPDASGKKGGDGYKLVSFQESSTAYNSYGYDNVENCDVGKVAAYKYATTLNYLLSKDGDGRYRFAVRSGDIVIVSWLSSGKEGGSKIIKNCLSRRDDSEAAAGQDELTEEKLFRAVKALARGESVDFDGESLNPHEEFFVLGLSVRNFRAHVVFFSRNSLGTVAKHVAEHEEAIAVQGYGGATRMPSIYELLIATQKQTERDSVTFPSAMVEALDKAIFFGAPYPATMHANALKQAKKELSDPRVHHAPSPDRLANIKAYLTRNNTFKDKEILKVSLVENSTSVPYNLGRLFAVYERIQEVATSPKVTIRASKLKAAMNTPSAVFPQLDIQAVHHLCKPSMKNRAPAFEKKISEIKSIFGDEGFPKRLLGPEPSAFILGYSHQRDDFFKRKVDAGMEQEETETNQNTQP